MQTQEKIAKRAMILSALVCRGFIDMDSPSEVEELRARLLPWIDSMGAREEVEKHELVALTAPLGTLDTQTRLNLVWVVEGLAVIAWAMGRYELHDESEVADPQAITQKLLFLSDKAKTLFEDDIKDMERLQALYEHSLTTLKETHKLVQNPATFTEDLSAKNSIAIERVRALKWLLADSGAYSEVDMSL